MKRNYAVATLTMALIAVLLAIVTFPANITGSAAYAYEGEERNTYAYTLNDWVRGFFQSEGIALPKGECMHVLGDIYNQIAFKPLSGTEDISTHGKNRFSSVMWYIEESMVGALEMIYSKKLSGNGADSVIHIIAEVPSRVPKISRTSKIEMHLLGTNSDQVYITHGSFSMPIMSCEFNIGDDGFADCECTSKDPGEYAAGKIGGTSIFES